MDDFIGVKIALLVGGKVIVIQRDNIPGLRYPGMWDLPGGARDNHETPLACVAREVYEELGIKLKPELITWQKQYPALNNPDETAYFMVADISHTVVNSIRFGDEGQGWKLMNIHEFMNDPEVIEPFKDRLQTYLDFHAQKPQ